MMSGILYDTISPFFKVQGMTLPYEGCRYPVLSVLVSAWGGGSVKGNKMRAKEDPRNRRREGGCSSDGVVSVALAVTAPCPTHTNTHTN